MEEIQLTTFWMYKALPFPATFWLNINVVSSLCKKLERVPSKNWPPLTPSHFLVLPSYPFRILRILFIGTLLVAKTSCYNPTIVDLIYLYVNIKIYCVCEYEENIKFSIYVYI